MLWLDGHFHNEIIIFASLCCIRFIEFRFAFAQMKKKFSWPLHDTFGFVLHTIYHSIAQLPLYPNWRCVHNCQFDQQIRFYAKIHFSVNLNIQLDWYGHLAFFLRSNWMKYVTGFLQGKTPDPKKKIHMDSDLFIAFNFKSHKIHGSKNDLFRMAMK